MSSSFCQASMLALLFACLGCQAPQAETARPVLRMAEDGGEHVYFVIWDGAGSVFQYHLVKTTEVHLSDSFALVDEKDQYIGSAPVSILQDAASFSIAPSGDVRCYGSDFPAPLNIGCVALFKVYPKYEGMLDRPWSEEELEARGRWGIPGDEGFPELQPFSMKVVKPQWLLDLQDAMSGQ